MFVLRAASFPSSLLTAAAPGPSGAMPKLMWTTDDKRRVETYEAHFVGEYALEETELSGEDPFKEWLLSPADTVRAALPPPDLVHAVSVAEDALVLITRMRPRLFGRQWAEPHMPDCQLLWKLDSACRWWARNMHVTYDEATEAIHAMVDGKWLALCLGSEPPVRCLRDTSALQCSEFNQHRLNRMKAYAWQRGSPPYPVGRAPLGGSIADKLHVVYAAESGG